MQIINKMPAIMWAFFIAILCGIPGKNLPSANWLELISFDKFVHASLFFVLNYLSNKDWNPLNTKVKYFTISLICIAYGGIIELLQASMFKDRSADILDFIANSVGVIIAFFFISKKKKLKN